MKHMRQTSLVLAFLFAVAGFMVADPALAQDAGLSDSARALLGQLVSGGAALAQSGASAEETPAKAYSTADESIYVVQRRAYSKRGMFELTPLFFTSVNNKFVGHLGPAISAVYHVRENFGIELTSAIPFVFYRFYSALVFEVRDLDPPLSPEVVDLKQLTYFGSLSLQFSALYGKLNLYDWLVDYDFYVSAGYGLATTIETCAPNKDGCGDKLEGLGFGQRGPRGSTDKTKLAANLGGGMRVFFSDHLGLRIDLRDIVYADRATDPEGATTDIRNNVMVLLGVSFLL